MSPPFVPVGVDHLVLWVEGLDRARAWYKTVLGCRDGLWDAAGERSKTASTLRGKSENLHHVALAWQRASEDADEITVTRELRQVGARGFGLALYFRDPSGNRIELKGPPDQVFQTPEGGVSKS